MSRCILCIRRSIKGLYKIKMRVVSKIKIRVVSKIKIRSRIRSIIRSVCGIDVVNYKRVKRFNNVIIVFFVGW